MIPTGFDPSKYMPQNPGYVGFEDEDSPEKAGAVARDWSERGIQPTMTNLPQEANSNQIAFDAMGKQPSEEDLALSQELDRFDSFIKKRLDERFGGDLSGVDPSMEAERAAERFIRSKLPNVPFAEENINPEYIKQANEVYKATFQNLANQKTAYQNAYLTGLNQFTQDYKSGKFSKDQEWTQGAVTTEGLSVGYNKKSGRWEVDLNGAKQPWDQNVHGRIQNAMSTTTLPDKSFRDWDENDKLAAFKEKLLTGKEYKFSNRDAASQQQYREEYGRFLESQGLTPETANAVTAHTKSLTRSLDQQEKQRGAMGNFVRNVNKQVEYAEQLFEYLQRTDIRALNIPLRLLRTKFKGSGLEQVYEMFIKEISAEAAKLSQGSTASIALLPEGNRQEWERVHDVNMPLMEQRKVLQGTSKLANVRMESVEEEIANTSNKIENIIDQYRTKPKTDTQTKTYKPEDVVKRGKKGGRRVVKLKDGSIVYE